MEEGKLVNYSRRLFQKRPDLHSMLRWNNVHEWQVRCKDGRGRTADVPVPNSDDIVDGDKMKWCEKTVFIAIHAALDKPSLSI